MRPRWLHRFPEIGSHIVRLKQDHHRSSRTDRDATRGMQRQRRPDGCEFVRRCRDQGQPWSVPWSNLL